MQLIIDALPVGNMNKLVSDPGSFGTGPPARPRPVSLPVRVGRLHRPRAGRRERLSFNHRRAIRRPEAPGRANSGMAALATAGAVIMSYLLYRRRPAFPVTVTGPGRRLAHDDAGCRSSDGT
jgi:hypothetical protein